MRYRALKASKKTMGLAFNIWTVLCCIHTEYRNMFRVNKFQRNTFLLNMFANAFHIMLCLNILYFMRFCETRIRSSAVITLVLKSGAPQTCCCIHSVVFKTSLAKPFRYMYSLPFRSWPPCLTSLGLTYVTFTLVPKH